MYHIEYRTPQYNTKQGRVYTKQAKCQYNTVINTVTEDTGPSFFESAGRLTPMTVVPARSPDKFPYFWSELSSSLVLHLHDTIHTTAYR